MLDVTSFNSSRLLWKVRMSSTYTSSSSTRFSSSRWLNGDKLAVSRMATWAIQPAGLSPMLTRVMAKFQFHHLQSRTTGICAGGILFPSTRRRYILRMSPRAAKTVWICCNQVTYVSYRSSPALHHLFGQFYFCFALNHLMDL